MLRHLPQLLLPKPQTHLLQPRKTRPLIPLQPKPLQLNPWKTACPGVIQPTQH
jgi:hypothetical protein